MKHYSNHGTHFSCDDKFLKGEITVTIPGHWREIKPIEYAADVAEFIGWWTANIYPDIPPNMGFSGFDCLKWKVKYEE